MPSFPSKKKAFVLWEYRKGYPIRQRPIYGQQSPRAHWGDYISEGTVWFCSHHTQKALPGCDNIRHSRSNLLLLLPQCLSGNPLFRAAAWHQDLIQMFLSSSLPLHIWNLPINLFFIVICLRFINWMKNRQKREKRGLKMSNYNAIGKILISII